MLLAATLPMLLPPLSASGDAAPRHRFFAPGFALNVRRPGARARREQHRRSLACAGMALTGSGTGLVNAQISSLTIALAPASRAGMASGIAP
jgi:hypothetical protein